MDTSELNQEVQKRIETFESLPTPPVSAAWEAGLLHKIKDLPPAQRKLLSFWSALTLVFLLINIATIGVVLSHKKTDRQEHLRTVETAFLSNHV
ncbi:MAG: hypothetical protein JNL70_08295 [Saprospiraceae bacterium]|nr:hypothetical protein [Saprospiraceae bacterium]